MDFGTSVRRQREADPLGFGAPMASRAFLGGLLGGLALGGLGSILGGMGAKSRGNEYEDLFNQQRDYQRGRFGLTENLMQSQLNKQGQFLQGSRQRDADAVGQARQMASGYLNKTGDAYQKVINNVNQLGQTARADIQDQGTQANAATQRNLTGRGLGNSTMLAGARAQNQEVTNRGLSSLYEGMAGQRAQAQTNLADFMKFRSQYEPGLVMQGREFNRQGDQGMANFMTQRTGMETGIADSHTGQDSNLLMNLINAAAGSKGTMTSTIGNTLGGLGNNWMLYSLLGNQGQ